MDHYRLVLFTLAVLYSLPEKWRGLGDSRSFDDLVRKRRGASLHLAWKELRDLGLLGEFADEFDFDPLYEKSGALDRILAKAAHNYRLVRLGGTDLNYHLDGLTDEQIQRVINFSALSAPLVRVAAKKLGELLEEQEKENSPAA